MLRNSTVVGFVATSMPELSKHFYNKVLGLTLLEESPFAIVFQANNTVIRVQKTEQAHPPPYTTLGWTVKNIAETVHALSAAGVQFEQYDGLEQDNTGLWNTPDGAAIAWFKDPDGNLLSLTQNN